MRATVWEARDDWRWGKGVCVQGSVCTAGHTDLSACIATGFCGGLGFQGVCVCVCVCVCECGLLVPLGSRRQAEPSL